MRSERRSGVGTDWPAPQEVRLMQPADERHPLLVAARAAFDQAYAPYSRFRVGAAVEAEDGSVFSAGNVENASYGLTVCAERIALFKLIGAGYRQVRAVAVAIETPLDAPEGKMPCGACRQVMAEFMDPDGMVLVDQVGQFALRELFPSPFVLR
jgi:cytidine deaminase